MVLRQFSRKWFHKYFYDHYSSPSSAIKELKRLLNLLFHSRLTNHLRSGINFDFLIPDRTRKGRLERASHFTLRTLGRGRRRCWKSSKEGATSDRRSLITCISLLVWSQPQAWWWVNQNAQASWRRPLGVRGNSPLAEEEASRNCCRLQWANWSSL